MLDFEKSMRIMAMLRGLENFSSSMDNPDGDSTEVKQKSPGQIFSETKIMGLKDEIQYLHSSITQFHEKVIKQNKEIEAAKKERDSLRKKLVDSEERVDTLRDKNISLLQSNGRLNESVETYSKRVSDTGRKLAKQEGIINKAIGLLNGMKLKSTKPKYVDCFKEVMKVLTNSGGNNTTVDPVSK